MKEIVDHNVKECPDKLFMGSRVPITAEADAAGNTFGEYKWKSFKQTYNEAQAIAKYLYHENLVPKITNEEGSFRFLGLYSKNREEWVVTDIACMISAVTSVPLYDTLGKESTEYILDQTEIKTIFCSADKVETLLSLKSLGKIKKATHIIYFKDVHGKKYNFPENEGLTIV